MKTRIQQLLELVYEAGAHIDSPDAATAFRNVYLARKGSIAALFDEMKKLPAEERPEAGKLLNNLRLEAERVLEDALNRLSAAADQPGTVIDLTLPGRKAVFGHKHLISKTIEEIKAIFQRLGFSVATGPELESDYYNFEALNFTADHPARDMQDTFFVSSDVLLRTHTTPVQIRILENQRPPVRSIMPGRVFRNEVVTARSHMQFHQVDGIYVDKGVTFADLKGTLVSFAKSFYGSSLQYRFRASYFPFTEPSAEMDITCYLCNGKGCRICKHSGWLEILGCGMVDPNVFGFVNVDPEEYSGYAFGMGVERTALLRYGLDDIRFFTDNDMRMNRQFN